jgi:predicted deacylase
MRVATLGEGDPEVAVVGGIHGDEPCGVTAVENLIADPPAVQRPVKLVVANEAAVDRGVRAVDADLNRSFPGDPGGDAHEARLAAALADELAGCTVLALHSTQSHPEPFAVVDGPGGVANEVCPRLPVSAVVDTARFVNGRLFAADAAVVEVECGRQGTPAAARTAADLTRAFLAGQGVLDGAPPAREHPLFRLSGVVEKPPAERYEVFAENFAAVAAGEAFAAADGERVFAEDSFYPVLLSAEGYADVFGYAAERVGTL